MTSIIGRLRVSLGLESGSFETGAKRASSSIEAFGTRAEKVGDRIGTLTKTVITAGAALAGSAIVGQLRDAARESFRFAESIQQAATLSAAGVEEFQQAAYAARTVGIDTAKLSDIYKDVQDKIGDFIATGGGELKEFFETIAPKVGVTAEQFKNLSGPQALQLYVSTLEQARIGQKEMVFYLEAIADDASRLLPLLLNNAAGFKGLAEEARNAGVVISEDEIKEGIEAQRQLAAIEEAQRVRQARMLIQHRESLIAFEESWGRFKVGMLGSLAEMIGAFDRWEAAIAKNVVAGRERVIAIFEGVVAAVVRFRGAIGAAVEAIASAIRNMVSQIAQQLRGPLNAAWDAAKRKIEEVRETFFNLWDRVTRRSYVPDMVDDIAREMARLDAVLVTPARRAVSATESAFREMAARVRPLLDRLFPDAARLRQYEDEMREIAAAGAAGAIDPMTAMRGRTALTGQFLAAQGEGSDRRFFGDAFDALIEKAGDAAGKVETANVRIVRSFKDMAEETVSALQRLTGAVKGGGFLDILGAVVGLGVQLGSVGAFGKTVADRINRAEPRAAGGPVVGGRPYLVGERGPELMVPRHSGTVVPSHALGGASRLEVRPSPLFEVWLDGKLVQAAPALMEGGATIAGRRAARAQAYALD